MEEFNTKRTKLGKHTKGALCAPGSHLDRGGWLGAERPFVFFESFASFVFSLESLHRPVLRQGPT